MPVFDYAQASQYYTPEQIHAFIASQPGIQVMNQPQEKTPTGQNTPQLSVLHALSAGYTQDQINQFAQQQGIGLDQSGMKQDSVVSQPAAITERVGQFQPNLEVFSHGQTTGTGLGVPQGTKAALPPGQWKVVSSFNGASPNGYIGNGQGQGWGNNTLVENTQTGEQLRYAHLLHNFTKQGDVLDGGSLVGLTGRSGNATGDHLNLQYIDPSGKVGDVLQSRYRNFIPVQGQ